MIVVYYERYGRIDLIKNIHAPLAIALIISAYNNITGKKD